MNSTLAVWQADSEPLRRLSIAARHKIFCEAGLQVCHALTATGPHDRYDRPDTCYFGLSYDSSVIGTARLIQGKSLDLLPTGRLLHRLPHAPVIVAGRRYSEASQFGLVKAYQRNPVIGERARLLLVGAVVSASVELGYDHFLLTLRGVVYGMLNWVPWELAEPFDYPPEEGGPLVIEPMWPATINLHELAAATAWLKPTQFRMMFPDPPQWLDLSKVRPRAELQAVAQRNQSMVRRSLRNWRDGLALPVLKS